LDFSPVELYREGNGNSGGDFGYAPQKQKFAGKLKIRKKKLAKKQKGGDDREKTGGKVARLEGHIGDTRRGFIETETLRLVRKREIIGVENLNLRGVAGFLRNAKNMVDTSGTFVSKLERKAGKNERDCQAIKVSRGFPSSRFVQNEVFKTKS
jgi:putative transposase